MKIALISHLYPSANVPYQGKFIKDQFNLLNRNAGIQAELIVPTPYSVPFTKRWQSNHADLLGENKANCRTFYLSFPGKKFPGIIRRSLSRNLKRKLSNSSFDILHIHWLYPDGLAIPELRKSGYKCVLTIHGSDWYKAIEMESLAKYLEDALEQAHVILCSGPSLKNDILDKYPQLEPNIRLVYNSVDEAKYRLPSQKDSELAREQLGWAADKKHILTVANFEKVKGLDVLLKAVKPDQSVQYHIIGRPSDADYFASLKEYMREKALNNITFHAAVRPDQLVSYYHAADIYVLPSRNEGFNVSLLEATACGLPVVCTAVGGNAEVINRKSGVVIEPENPRQLQEALQTLINSLNSYDKEEIRKETIARFSEKAMQKRLISLYQELAD